MAINASDFIKMIGIGTKKKGAGYKGTSGRAPQAPPPIAPMPGVGIPDRYKFGGIAPPVTGGLDLSALMSGGGGGGGGGGDDSGAWLAMALSALGGGPDRNAYVAPFDAAEQRARGAHAQAVPNIAQNYDRMRSELGSSQQVVNRDADQARQQMAAVQASLQGQMAQNAAPILADLKSQGNTPALGGLLGAAQAQIGTGQAQLAQQAATQQQLSGNMQAASTASHNSRIADSQLAQGAATSSSQNTLNQVLAQLDQKKASALQQYAQDAQQHQSAVAKTKMAAMDRASSGGSDDPGRQLDLRMKELDYADRLADFEERRSGGAGGAAGANRYTSQLNDFQMKTAEKNPVAWSLLTEFVTAGGEKGTPLPTVVANIRSKANKNNKIMHNGKRIDATWLIDRAKELDELERREEEEERMRTEYSKPKSRSRRR